MKKTKSIFFKIALYITPIVLALDALMLILSYNIVYDSNLQYCEKQIRNAANSAAQIAEGLNLEENSTRSFLSEYYTELCGMYDITYIFAILPDVDKNTETYLAIGFGDDASQEAIDTRYPGVVVTGMLNEQEKEAYKGNKSGVILHEKMTFGDSLVCYMPSYSSRYEEKKNRDRTNTEEPAQAVAPPVGYDPETGEVISDETSVTPYVERRTQIVVGAEISLSTVMRSFQERFNLFTVVTITLTLVMVVAFAVILYFRISRPVRRISGRMSSFVTDREKDKAVEKLEVKGDDEFSLMANSFNIMTEEIDRYIGDISALNREKHTQEAELNIARNIQMGLLQPSATDGERFSIRAYMLPAKDVGGDLYDYRLLDDGRIFAAIADVSGKGISAALFMSRAITLLHQYAAVNASPAQILTEFNNILAAQNPGGMFITTFIAIYDPATGLMTYSNAGHNDPYILCDRLVPLRDGHGVAAGLFEGESYEDAVIALPAGGTLFLYTDGVNEAKNTENAFYTTERLEEKLSGCIRQGADDPLRAVLDDLNRFTRGADQSDDITMLSLHIAPRPEETVLRLPAQLQQLAVIRDAIRALDVTEDLKRTLYLAAEEIFVNICSYAYDADGEVTVRIVTGERVELTFEDSGKPFDPTADLLDIDDYDHENRIGGLGRFLTFTIADEYRYAYLDGRNVLTLYFTRGE